MWHVAVVVGTDVSVVVAWDVVVGNVQMRFGSTKFD